MKLSRSAAYAILSVGHVASQNDSRPVQAKVIAKAHHIPVEYLLKILQHLVRANILRSVRGPQGGFLLARRPAEIDLLSILEAIEGPLEGRFPIPPGNGQLQIGQHVELLCNRIATQAKRMLSEATTEKLIGNGQEM